MVIIFIFFVWKSCDKNMLFCSLSMSQNDIIMAAN